MVITFHNKLQKIYHLFYLRCRLVNCHVSKKWGVLEHMILDELKIEVIEVGPGSIMVKRNMKDVF